MIIVQLVGVILRLVVDAIDCVLRVIIWLLEQVCLGLEAISEYIRGDYIPEYPAPAENHTAPPRPSAERSISTGVKSAGVSGAARESDHDLMVRKLGYAPRSAPPDIHALADTLLNTGQRVPINSE